MLLEELLRDRPDAPALHAGGIPHSRGALAGASGRAAALLARLGLRRGDAIALWLGDGPAWLQFLFGAARLGLLVIPVSTRYREREARHLLEVSGARAVVASSRFLDVDYAAIVDRLRPGLPRLEHVIGVADADAFHPGGTGDAPTVARADDPLVAFSTSGTTGFPKLAVHDQGSTARHLEAVAHAFDLRPSDATLCALPLYGTFGFVTALSAIAGGANCVLQPVWNAQSAAHAFAAHGITHFVGADAMVDAILAVPGAQFPAWRRAGIADFVGLAARVVALLETRCGARASGLYGSSECFAFTAIRDVSLPAGERWRAGGRPVDAGIAFRIVDPDSGETVPAGRQGELQLRGPNVTSGYLNNSGASARAFTADGWFRTGDLGTDGGDGSFGYLARMNDSLRLRGYLVDPSEIEAFLMTVPGVLAAQVVGVRREGEGDVAVAFVRAGAAAPDEAALLAHCRERIAAYKVPRRIVRVDAFPTVNGPNGEKVQKSRLREQAARIVA